jgi:hypothetical protein
MIEKEITVYIDPWDLKLYNNRFFGENGGDNTRVDYLNPFIYLREKCKKNGINLNTADFIPENIVDGRFIYYYSFGQIDNLEKLRLRKDIKFCSIYLFEPPIKVLNKKDDINYRIDELAELFSRVYLTCSISSINKVYKINLQSKIEQFSYPQSYSTILEKHWKFKGKNLLVMVNSFRYSRLSKFEFYSERNRALSYFLVRDNIDFYGSDWEDLGKSYYINILKSIFWGLKWGSFSRLRNTMFLFNVRKKLIYVKPSYDKYSVLAKYKFALCYESMGLDGFITEKIFDCFFAGTIPIYLGAPDITNYIPANTFIDKRKFDNYNDLFYFISNLNDVEYEKIRFNIMSFINSELFENFSMEKFSNRFIDDVKNDINL